MSAASERMVLVTARLLDARVADVGRERRASRRRRRVLDEKNQQTSCSGISRSVGAGRIRCHLQLLGLDAAAEMLELGRVRDRERAHALAAPYYGVEQVPDLRAA